MSNGRQCDHKLRIKNIPNKTHHFLTCAYPLVIKVTIATALFIVLVPFCVMSFCAAWLFVGGSFVCFGVVSVGSRGWEVGKLRCSEVASSWLDKMA